CDAYVAVSRISTPDSWDYDAVAGRRLPRRVSGGQHPKIRIRMPDGEDVLADVVRVASQTLGDRLIAVYALGSLAHGGFSPLVSDIDAAVILTDPVRRSDPDSIHDVADQVRALGSALHS